MFETIRRQFLVEVTGDGDPARHHVTSLDEVNQLLDHWVHTACHQQVHSETGQTPRQRWEAAARPICRPSGGCGKRSPGRCLPQGRFLPMVAALVHGGLGLGPAMAFLVTGAFVIVRARVIALLFAGALVLGGLTGAIVG